MADSLQSVIESTGGVPEGVHGIFLEIQWHQEMDSPLSLYLRRHRYEKKEKDLLILAIESSCDETAAAVVKNGREVLSNVISSQIALHTLYGGVVPEIASRKHIEKINQVIRSST